MSGRLGFGFAVHPPPNAKGKHDDEQGADNDRQNDGEDGCDE